MLRLEGLLALSLLSPCLWDRDTLRAEVQGTPGMAEIIVGRFDRFPDAYYEARLEDCIGRIQAGTDELGLFDDAGVACDRLGRSDEAIEWMARKRVELDANSEPDPFHEYTYLANLGTFHAHRWIRSGADRSALDDLERAHDLVSRAIALNPDAHFGRERYQKLALEWLLEPDAPTEEIPAPSLLTKAVGERVDFPMVDTLEQAGLGDAAIGISGLVHLGDAWDAAPIWLALSQALEGRGDASLARLAGLRLCEVVRAAPERPPYPGFDPDEFLASMPGTLEQHRRAELDRWYERARRAADAWRASRDGYLEARVLSGDHPDRNDAFWADWSGGDGLPPFPGEGGARILGLSPVQLAAVLGVAVLALAVALRRQRGSRVVVESAA